MKKQQIPKQHTRALIDVSSIKKDEKQFDVVFATETPVFRRHWDENFYEILVCNKENMRTERLTGGVVPLLDNHDKYSGITKQYGSVISWEVKKGECRATIQFSLDPAHDGIWKNIEAGIYRGISAGYIPWVYQRELVAERNEPNYRAIDWEPTEISLAPIPLDYNSKVRSENETTFEIEIKNFKNQQNTRSKMEGQEKTEVVETTGQKERSATAADPAKKLDESKIAKDAVQAERTRVSDINTAVRNAGLEQTFADTLISEGTDINQARALIIDKMAEKNTAPAVRTANSGNATASGDEFDQVRSSMESVILHRAEGTKGKLEGMAADMRSMKLVDMARHLLERKGDNPFKYSTNEMISRAIATTDFPDILTSTVNRQLRRYFEAVNAPWEFLGQRTTVSDFRAKTGLQVDGSLTFDKIAEDGEYKSAKILQNSKASIAVETYGKVIKISRKAIINDDLDVFSRIPKMISQGAKELQASMFWGMITNNAKTPDGKTIFHADHNNLAGAGATISETTLNAAIIAMVKQQSPAGLRLGIRPKYLIVPVELEMTAKKLLASITAAKTGDVNTFQNAFEIVSEVRLSENSATSWYMAADPSSVDGLQYAYLDGEEGLFTESRTNFDDDSVETKARMEFGVAAWEHRGWYKNPGA